MPTTDPLRGEAAAASRSPVSIPMASLKNCKWFHEELAPHEVHMHGVKSTLYSKTSQFQQIDIIDTEGYGLCLVLDGKLQSTESDEFIYHEALVHAAMLTHPSLTVS